MTRLRARARADHGQATVEIIAMLPLLVVAALIALQLQLFASTANAAEHAARNASRAMRSSDDPVAAARAALSGSSADQLRSGDVRRSGERVTVAVHVPFVLSVVPGLSDTWLITRDARIPHRD